MSGEGVLAKYAKYGLGVDIYVCIYISPSFPEISVSVHFLISCQNQGGGERKEVTESQV